MRYIILIILLTGLYGFSQDPERFREEVQQIQKKYDTLWDQSRDAIVFTGSSSIRIWNDLPEMFPGHQVINSGFGGSQASDLLAYTNELILRFKPKEVFIYEGDNDLNARKRPRKILEDTGEIIRRIRALDPSTRIVLIAAKPSLARWKLRGRYKRFNRKLARFCRKDGALEFANIWDVMLTGRKVRDDIFIEDGLHMNEKGYALWYTIIKEYIN